MNGTDGTKAIKRYILVVAVIASLVSCAAYNRHIKECDGNDVSTAHLVIDYLPVGALIDNGACAVRGK